MTGVADGLGSATGALLLTVTATATAVFLAGMAVELRVLKKFMMKRISSCEALASAAPEEKAVVDGSSTQSFDWAALKFYTKDCEEWAMCLRTTGEIIVDEKQAELLEAVSDALRTQHRQRRKFGCMYDLRVLKMPPIGESYLRCRQLAAWCGAQTIKEEEEGGGYDTGKRRGEDSAAARRRENSRSLIEATVHSVAIVLPSNHLVASVVSFFLWIGRGSMETRIFKGDRGAAAADAFLLEREAIYRTKAARLKAKPKVEEEEDAVVGGIAQPVQKGASSLLASSSSSSSPSATSAAEIEARARSLPSVIYS